MEGLGNREVGGDDKIQGTRYYRMNKEKRERSRVEHNKGRGTPQSHIA